MSSCREALIALVLAGSALGAWAQAAKPAKPVSPAEYPGIGRAATPKEVQAWDIDVRPDFKGLPNGAGTVARGQEVWEAKCASCHGVFGESNEVFSPLVGGTTKEDVKTGRVARLTDPGFPGRTTLMKVPTVSTLWDYIHRAMPWNAPKSLTPDQVYAVTAYLLNLGEVIPADFVLSDRNIAEVQQRMPNRNGMTTDHGLWPGRGMGNGGKPDVQGTACMKDCRGEPKVASFLPDFARNAHGNLAEQNRLVGAQVGADTTRPPGAPPAAPAAPKPAAPAAGGAPTALLAKYTCTACHGMDNKVVGPGFAEVARKYAGRPDREAYLAGKIVAGGSGVWGSIPMPAQVVPDEDVRKIAAWLAQGARK
jgi:cytochrome c